MANSRHSRLDHFVSLTPIMSTHQSIGIEIKTPPPSSNSCILCVSPRPIWESPPTRAKNRPLWQWFVSGENIPEKGSQHHLGILRTVSPSSSARTSEHCSAGRSAFFSCNAVGLAVCTPSQRKGYIRPSAYQSYCTEANYGI